MRTCYSTIMMRLDGEAQVAVGMRRMKTRSLRFVRESGAHRGEGFGVGFERGEDDGA